MSDKNQLTEIAEILDENQMYIHAGIATITSSASFIMATMFVLAFLLKDAPAWLLITGGIPNVVSGVMMGRSSLRLQAHALKCKETRINKRLYQIN
jgi:hypothetical protein